MLSMRLLLRCCLSGLLLLALAAQAQRVYLVASESTPSYQQAIDAFTQELARLGVPRADWHQLTLSELARTELSAEEGRLFVTWGAEAFRQTLTRAPRAPVLAALIPRLGFERVLTQTGHKAGPLLAGLYLDQPFARQLELLHLAMPLARDVGVIWGPDSVAQQPWLAAAARSRSLVLHESTLAAGEPLIGTLRAATSEVDLLLAVPDAHVFNPATATDILLATYRSRVPVQMFSPSYVKAGAMLALHTLPEQVGTQAAAMAFAYLQSGSLGTCQYPGDFSVSVNEHVARSFGLQLDARWLTQQLRQQERRP